MSVSIILLTIIILAAFSYMMGKSRALAVVGGDFRTLHSRPPYYGYYVAIWCAIPALIVVTLWMSMETTIIEQTVLATIPAEHQVTEESAVSLLINDIRNIAEGSISSRVPEPWLQEAADHYISLRDTARMALLVVVVAIVLVAFGWSRSRISEHLRARNTVERVVRVLLLIASGLAILTTIGIILSLLFESIRFFNMIPPMDFLFGLEWSPQTALRDDQVGGSGLFGAVPLFAGTMLISFIAMCVAAPVGLMAAIYMSEYAPTKVRNSVKPVLEILAGIPTVVYGFFAALTVAPFFRNVGEGVGFSISSESALAAGIVMGIMIIPFVSSLSDDVISAVPQAMREGSYGLGATQSETIRQVILPAALPGVVGSLLLAASRAIGETMIVVMAAGLSANLTANPFEAVTTVTVQIVTLLVGDQEFDSAKTLAAFALGLVLFFVTLGLNVVALTVVNKYREQYE